MIDFPKSADGAESEPGSSSPESPLHASTTALKRAPHHRDVMRAALTIAVLTAIVRIASVGKELTIAWRFGTSDHLDAFLISILVPVAIVGVLSGAFSASFIPIYIETKENEGLVSARNLFQSVAGWVLLLLCLVSVLVACAAPWYLPLLGSGFGVEKFRFTLKLVWFNSLIVIPGGMAAVWTAALNAERRFAVAAAAPLTTPVLTLVIIWLAPGFGTFGLVAGMIAGSAIEMVLVGLALNRLGLTIRVRWPRMDPKIRRLAAQFLPVMSGAVLNSGNFLIDQAMAAMLATGSVAALNYGNRVVQFPLALSAAALGTALMPYLSRLAAARDWLELNRTVRRYIKLSFIITLPLTAGLFLFSKPIVSLIFYRGAFTVADVELVSRIQAFYALQIPSYLV